MNGSSVVIVLAVVVVFVNEFKVRFAAGSVEDGQELALARPLVKFVL